MLIEAGRSVLLVIDVQERLLPAMAEPRSVVDHCTLLAKAAARLEVPALLSEQYPKGLGPTVPDLAALVPAASIHPKLHFSCAADPGLSRRLSEIGRPQIVIAGIETHVCVLQTALGFHARGFHCFVVADATSSRTEANKSAGLARLRADGVEVVTAEMVVFEWLGQAGTPAFRDLARLIK